MLHLIGAILSALSTWNSPEVPSQKQALPSFPWTGRWSSLKGVSWLCNRPTSCPDVPVSVETWYISTSSGPAVPETSPKHLPQHTHSHLHTQHTHTYINPYPVLVTNDSLWQFCFQNGPECLINNILSQSPVFLHTMEAPLGLESPRP